MTRLLCIAVLAAALAWALHPRTVAADPAYQGSSFSNVWSQVESDPYALPHYSVTLASFYGFFRNYLLENSRRTLNDFDDLLPRFNKLLHPNGICLAGTWNITEQNPYTGAFRPGSRLFIARASTALTRTTSGDYRAFGLAGKVFPTLDPNAVVPTANFVTIEDLGGTLRDHFLDALNTNDIIHISTTSEFLLNSALALAVVNAFKTADNTTDQSQVLIRQLYPLAQSGEADPSTARAPTWLKIVGSSDVPRVDAADFRDELRVRNYPGGLRFDIYIADQGTREGDKNWYKIGYIDATEDAVSDSCDHRLHFHHPPFVH
jgi:hypothetical protein